MFFIDIKHSKNYSIYVDKEKSNIIEGLKLTYQESCSSSFHVDNTTPSEKALTASYTISNLQKIPNRFLKKNL